MEPLPSPRSYAAKPGEVIVRTIRVGGCRIDFVVIVEVLTRTGGGHRGEKLERYREVED